MSSSLTGSSLSQWSGMSSNVAHSAPVAPPQNQYQIPYELLCGCSQDFEPRPVPPAPLGIPSISQSLPPTLHSYQNVGQVDTWMRDFLHESMDICPSSPDGDTGLSGFLGAFADYDFLADARAHPPHPQPSIALTRDCASSIQSTAFPSNEPGPSSVNGPYRDARFFECQWLTNGALCETRVNADRRSVVGHLQHVHGIRPGEEKARGTCLWEHCRTMLNKESLARHILTVHLKERVQCTECGVFFAREDSLKRHLKGSQHKVPPEKSAARQPSRNHAGS